MSISYRLATLRDLNDLVRLRLAMQSEVSHAHPDLTALEQALRDYFLTAIPREEFLAFLAESDDVVIASSGMVFHQHPPGAGNLTGRGAYIMNMYTAPEFRGRGIAGELLSGLLRLAREKGIRHVVLHGLPKGRGIYLKAGFIPGETEMTLDLAS
jgi:GNAT superfamily N-acetyltransferase